MKYLGWQAQLQWVQSTWSKLRTLNAIILKYKITQNYRQTPVSYKGMFDAIIFYREVVWSQQSKSCFLKEVSEEEPEKPYAFKTKVK